METNILYDFYIYIGIVALILALPIAYYFYQYALDDKYRRYIVENSMAIKNLKLINSRYSFNPVLNFDLVHEYDNESYYNQISPRDYLIYNLVDQYDNIQQAINNANYNRNLFARYEQDVKNNCFLNTYSENIPFKHFKRFQKLENEIFNSMKQQPVLVFRIKVDIYLTKINGRLLSHKCDSFNESEIEEIICLLKRKNNGRYVVNDIWRAICRVERGKVSNKIRFAVYERDGYRCRFCGSDFDLEIDHILPISKGGKSNVSNLQTLCHNCNYSKSNSVDYANKYGKSFQKSNWICPHCGAQLILRDGEYGVFYGCSNYPNCRYTRKL